MNYENLTKEQLINEIYQLQTRQKYGLVFKEHPEDIINKSLGHIPVFEEVRDNCVMGGGVDHLLLEGDNHPALLALSSQYKGRVDVIYIDPPYNTGNKDFVYNDSFVDKEDAWRHSKWLSFMNRRLRLAKELLSDDGVIFISIDDNEQAQLKLLCDQVFGENNFISSLVWSAGRKNQSKFVSVSHEYVLMYVKDKQFLIDNNIKFKSKKEGLDDIFKMVNKLYKECGNYELSSTKMKKWFNSLPDNNPSKQHKHYCNIDENGLFFNDNISAPGGNGAKYEILHPITKKPCVVPSRGWAYKKETMGELIKNSQIQFGDNETKVPCRKKYLKDVMYEVMYSVFYNDGRGATKRLMEMFGKKIFDYPKDEKILSKLINLHPNKNATILDFFAGSGTTLHAVAELNKEDGGQRKCILITNNENQICENITYQRCKKVITGYITPKGKTIEPTGGNLHYYRLNWVEQDQDAYQMRQNLKAHMTPLICMAEETFQPYWENGSYDIFQNEDQTKITVVLKKDTPQTIGKLKVALKPIRGPIVVYQANLTGGVDSDLAQRLGKRKLQVKSSVDDYVKLYKSLTHRERLKYEEK